MFHLFWIEMTYNGNLSCFVEKAPFRYLSFGENGEFAAGMQLVIDNLP